MDGVLAIWKHEGWTSHDVVAKARRLLGMKRIGHAGTLDPMVTGVLPLCLGRSTRVVEYIQERPKAYEAVIRLGVATDTEDMTGQVIETAPVSNITESLILQVLQSFKGEIDQIPPMFSAVKVDGKRLYELAREGKQIERKSRKVTIHSIELIHTNLDGAEPEFTFSVVCSKGTYIRTLCVDIGKALGVPATMSKLTRTMSAGITADSCLTLEQLEQVIKDGELQQHLIKPGQAIDHLPLGIVKEDKRKYAIQGQILYFIDVQTDAAYENGQLIRIFDEADYFIGVFEMNVHAQCFKPIKVFS